MKCGALEICSCTSCVCFFIADASSEAPLSVTTHKPINHFEQSLCFLSLRLRLLEGVGKADCVKFSTSDIAAALGCPYVCVGLFFISINANVAKISIRFKEEHPPQTAEFLFERKLYPSCEGLSLAACWVLSLPSGQSKR